MSLSTKPKYGTTKCAECKNTVDENRPLWADLEKGKVFCNKSCYEAHRAKIDD